MKLTLGLSSEAVVPSLVESLAGVGLIRGEYVFRRLRQHVTVPAAQRWLTEYLVDVAVAFAPAPVWYRVADLEAREVSVLEGCDDDIVDRVAMLGTRGVRRAMVHPGVFDLELAAFDAAARDHANLGLLFPFIAEPEELAWARDRARDIGISSAIGCMAEVPGAVVALGEIVDLGVDRVVVGCNDLGSLTMGVERGSTRYAPVSTGLARMIDLAREATAAREVELAIAGYLTPDHLDVARRAGVDECVVHYADLPGLLGPTFADLPELGAMAEIKRWTRRALAERGPQLGRPGVGTTSLHPERRRWPRTDPDATTTGVV